MLIQEVNFKISLWKSVSNKLCHEQQTANQYLILTETSGRNSKCHVLSSESSWVQRRYFLMIFSFLLDTNTKATACDLNEGLLERWLQRHAPLLSIILALEFQMFHPALGTLSLWGSHPRMLRIHSSQPERFLDRSTLYPPVSVRTLFRGRDEEMRQKAAESTDAHISSARSREWFISFYHKSQVFLQGFALDFQSVLMAVKNHMPKLPGGKAFHFFPCPIWLISWLLENLLLHTFSLSYKLVQGSWCHPYNFVSKFKFKLGFPLSALPIYLWLLTK